MKLLIAGGCGEHGRNCFLLEGAEFNVMVDCGVMEGAEDGLPRLTQEDIRRTRYVLLTHSHKDHTGGLEWLVRQGFDGTFVMTAETARQLPFTLIHTCLLDTPEKVESAKLDGIKLRYGMSGHCAGAVWYLILWDDKRVFFSGDYNFYSDVYDCAIVQDHKADIAVIDSCYPEDEYSQGQFTDEMRAVLAGSNRLLLPAPRYGRGLELLLLLMRRFPQVSITADSHLQSELKNLKAIKKWLRPDAYQELRRWKPEALDTGRHALLVSDAQLNGTVGRYTAAIYAQEHYPILLSGHVDEGSYAQTLLKNGLAQRCILPVHNSDAECRMLKRANHFKRIIPAHTPRLNGPKEILF